MKKLMQVVLAAALLMPAAMQADILEISPGSQTVDVGQTFSVAVRVTGGVNIFGAQFFLGYDPLLLEVAEVSEGEFLPSGGPTFPISDTSIPGTVLYSSTLLGDLPGVSGEGELARLSFKALAAGTAALTLFDALLVRGGIDNTADWFETVDGSVTIREQTGPQPVPEPHSALLLLTAAGLLAIRVGRRA